MKAGQHFKRDCLTPSFLDEKSCISDTSCMKYRKDPAVIRCLDCHLHTRLCGLCNQLVHNFHPFHDCDAVKSGFPSPIPPTVSTDNDGEWIFVGMWYIWILEVIVISCLLYDKNCVIDPFPCVANYFCVLAFGHSNVKNY